MTTFLSNRSIYESVICGIVPEVRERLRFNPICRRVFCGGYPVE